MTVYMSSKLFYLKETELYNIPTPHHT